jgi:hypothetical protein
VVTLAAADRDAAVPERIVALAAASALLLLLL